MRIGSALLAGGLLAFALSFDEVIVTTFTTGGGEMTVDWSVRASATDEEIYSLQVVGSATESRYQDADLNALIEAVMADATDRLATDPGFRSLFVNRSDDPLPENLNNTALTGSLFP